LADLEKEDFGRSIWNMWHPQYGRSVWFSYRYMGLLFLLYLTGFIPLKPMQPFFPQHGGIRACSYVFGASSCQLYIDSRYEKKTLYKYYFWIIWYPFFIGLLARQRCLWVL